MTFLRHLNSADCLLSVCLENRIVNCKSCKEQDKVSVPKTGRNVVPNAFVLALLTLVLVLDTDNIFLEIERAKCESCQTDQDEKYVCHVINIIIRT